MKCKTTKKSIMNNYSNIIQIGYCDLQSLLRNRTPEAYTFGTYGWNADIYNIEDIQSNTIIVTGYRPFGNIQPNYELIKKYNDYAKSSTTFELNTLLHKFITEAICDT